MMPTLEIPESELEDALKVLRAGLRATEGRIRTVSALRLMAWCIEQTQCRDIEDKVGRKLKWNWKSF